MNIHDFIAWSQPLKSGAVFLVGPSCCFPDCINSTALSKERWQQVIGRWRPNEALANGWAMYISILKSGSSGKPQPIQAIQALRKCFNQTTRKKWNLEAAAWLVYVSSHVQLYLILASRKPHASRSKSSAPGLPILLTSESSNCKGSNIFARHACNLSHKTCMVQSNWWDSLDARSPKYGLCQHAGAKSSNHRCTPRTPGQSGQRRKLQGHVFRTLTFFKITSSFFFADLQWSTS